MSSHRSWMILAATAAAVLFVSVHSIRAADFAGSVQGVVKSASGQALPGAYVKLINPERRLTFMAVSQAQGRYTVSNLPPGDYTVQGIGNGFQSKPMPVSLTADKPATADVALTDTQADVPNGWIRSPGASPATNWITNCSRQLCPTGTARRLWKRSAPNAIFYGGRRKCDGAATIGRRRSHGCENASMKSRGRSI